ncbi:unnamed protein product [Didymodactylos carnosus]|uniref:Uncharacterized protein n=1 Tax=Didymodactylos carnosus TaxID=1234261 RepID=A0A8S2DBU4_9BILA|nr:unnamed protein product [Didymodactylos carnosus]CAF3641552.1 unnamed protein product [Didymodactylos carnosus]
MNFNANIFCRRCLIHYDTTPLSGISFTKRSIRALHFYENKYVLTGIENFFNYYYQNMAKHYGAKSQLCTIHLHLHLKEQLLKHGSLSLTSCFPREDYLRNSLKWCQVKKYVLEQFIPWYLVDRKVPVMHNWSEFFFLVRLYMV